MDHIGEAHQHTDRAYCTTAESVSPAALQSLDTVRTLHQTVVSLRTALEAAHREIDTLKRQIVVTTDIRDGKAYHVQQETDIERGYQQAVANATAAELRQVFEEHFEIPPAGNTNDPAEKVSTGQFDDATNDYCNIEGTPKGTARSKRKLRASTTATQRIVNVEEVRVIDKRGSGQSTTSIGPNIHIVTQPSKHGKQMASKIDVKIRLSSDIKVNGSSSETGSDTNSVSETPRDDSTEKSDAENVDAAPMPDEGAASRSANAADATNVPVVEVGGAEALRDEEADDVFLADGDGNKERSQNDSRRLRMSQSPRRSGSENQDEVDDIDLIFSSDDKEFTQEDLISISYYEPWQKCGKSGTPILTNFASIGSDQEGNDELGSETAIENVACSTSDIDTDGFYNALKAHKLRSNDSLNQRGCLGKESDNGPKADDSFDTFEEQVNYTKLGRRWTNYNVLLETDISKCGITEEGSDGASGNAVTAAEMRRRNTCPNPPAYRPIIHREAMRRHNMANPSVNRCPLAVKFSRNARSQYGNSVASPRPIIVDPNKDGPKRSSSAQTDISALPEHWRSESHLNGGMGSVFFTLPSKFVAPPGFNYYRVPLKLSKKTREARRVLLSDINFTSMVPELSRSADHLCQGEAQQNAENNNNSNVNIASASGEGGGNQFYYKGSHLKTPDYLNRGITPSVSMTSPGVSQWTVNENSFGAQTTQTDHYWNAAHGDSFDSCRDFSMGSKYSASFGKHCRSRSCSSVRCHLCKHRNREGLKMSESMNHTPLVTLTEPSRSKTRSSLPDLRSECTCGCARNRNTRNSTSLRFGDSYGSTESLIDEAEDFLCKSIDGVFARDDGGNAKTLMASNRRCSENDIKRDYSPSKQSLPFLPKSPNCLKPGHLAKVIAKNGRCVIGRVRYIGPLVSTSAANEYPDNGTFIGLQLPNKIGDCDGSFENRKFFECEPNYGMFVPFKKIVMAWTS